MSWSRKTQRKPRNSVWRFRPDKPWKKSRERKVAGSRYGGACGKLCRNAVAGAVQPSKNTGTSPALCGPTVVLWNLRVWRGERRALKQGRERRTAVQLSRGRKGGQNPQVCVCRCWARQDLLQKLQKKRFYRSEPC